MTEPSWQEFLWALPSSMGAWWYVIWGVVGVVASVVIFAVAILGRPFSAMFASRVLFCYALALIPLAALNSGWQPWITAIFVASGFIGALSLTVERCDREMEITTVGAAFIEKAKRAAAIVSRLVHRGSA